MPHVGSLFQVEKVTVSIFPFLLHIATDVIPLEIDRPSQSQDTIYRQALGPQRGTSRAIYNSIVVRAC